MTLKLKKAQTPSSSFLLILWLRLVYVSSHNGRIHNIAGGFSLWSKPHGFQCPLESVTWPKYNELSLQHFHSSKMFLLLPNASCHSLLGCRKKCVIAPEVETFSVLPQTVKQMWPFICQFVDKLFRETIEPAVKGANPHLSSFCFTKIDMGQKVTTPRQPAFTQLPSLPSCVLGNNSYCAFYVTLRLFSTLLEMNKPWKSCKCSTCME